MDQEFNNDQYHQEEHNQGQNYQQQPKNFQQNLHQPPMVQQNQASYTQPDHQIQVPIPNYQDRKLEFSSEISKIINTVGTLELTEEQSKILSEPVRDEEVSIKDDGTVYLSWIKYAHRLSKAFTGVGWGMIPEGIPRIKESYIVWGFHLVIKGVYCGFAYGEQKIETHRMSHGDACEAAKSNALMRLCKAIGIGLELWDKNFTNKWIDTYANVETIPGQNGGKTVKKYKLKPNAFANITAQQKQQVQPQNTQTNTVNQNMQASDQNNKQNTQEINNKTNEQKVTPVNVNTPVANANKNATLVTIDISKDQGNKKSIQPNTDFVKDKNEVSIKDIVNKDVKIPDNKNKVVGKKNVKSIDNVPMVPINESEISIHEITSEVNVPNTETNKVEKQVPGVLTVQQLLDAITNAQTTEQVTHQYNVITKKMHAEKLITSDEKETVRLHANVRFVELGGSHPKK